MAAANRLWEYIYMSRGPELARSAIAFQYQPKLYYSSCSIAKMYALHVYTCIIYNNNRDLLYIYILKLLRHGNRFKKKKRSTEKCSGHGRYGRYSSYATVFDTPKMALTQHSCLMISMWRINKFIRIHKLHANL